MAASQELPSPIQRPAETFSGQAVSVLRDMVLSGRLRAGERLNEIELAKALGISRGPLREAIQRLRTEGLLTAVSGRGSFVRTFEPEALADLYEVRIALECHAVALAAQSPDEEGIEAVRQVLDETEEALGSGGAYPSELDFHQQIVALANNQSLLEAATAVHRQIHLARSRSAHVSVRAREAFEEHKQVLQHVVDGNADKAANLLKQHLYASLENAAQLLNENNSDS